jgi:hypothetical protein
MNEAHKRRREKLLRIQTRALRLIGKSKLQPGESWLDRIELHHQSSCALNRYKWDCDCEPDISVRTQDDG